MSGITWKECKRCNGAGMVESAIEEGTRYNCGACGGHGQTPEEGGPTWFIRWHEDKRLQKVAVLQREQETPGPKPNLWRVTIFDRRGPVTHEVDPADQIMNRLDGFRSSAVAPRWLDLWSTCEEWREGVEHMTLLAYSNLFSFHGLRNETRAINFLRAREGAAPALALAGRLKRRHLPDSELF